MSDASVSLFLIGAGLGVLCSVGLVLGAFLGYLIFTRILKTELKQYPHTVASDLRTGPRSPQVTPAAIHGRSDAAQASMERNRAEARGEVIPEPSDAGPRYGGD